MSLRKLIPYIRIARFDHWIKNIFMLPGLAFGYLSAGAIPATFASDLFLSLLSLGLLASANYTINEYLDAAFDRYHPQKQNRAGVKERLDGRLVWLEYALLASSGLGLALLLTKYVFFSGLVLLIMGLFYNVRPFRTKERVYVDVLTESVNNPIRFMFGWFSAGLAAFPPSSILISYWMGGAFLMGMKRFAEYRSIADPKVAALYRTSFKYYTEQTLLQSSFFYALVAALFLGIFLIKYRIEYLLLFPFVAWLFTHYLGMAFRTSSAAQAPEKLFRERRLMLLVGFLVLGMLVLFLVDIAPLQFFLRRMELRQ